MEKKFGRIDSTWVDPTKLFFLLEVFLFFSFSWTVLLQTLKVNCKNCKIKKNKFWLNCKSIFLVLLQFYKCSCFFESCFIFRTQFELTLNNDHLSKPTILGCGRCKIVFSFWNLNEILNFCAAVVQAVKCIFVLVGGL